MKQYTVEITEEALADMEQLYNHIAFVLLASDNAMGQYNRIADAILKLDVFPERFRIMDSEPEHSKGISRLRYPSTNQSKRCMRKWSSRL